jgi:hypothetical protein
MRRLNFLLICLLVPVVAVALASPAGKYTGTWVGLQSDGGINIELAQSAKGEWTADVSFTLGGQETKCKTIRIKVDGDKLDLAYEFNLGGLQATSTVDGKFDGDKLEGKYTTRSSEGVDVDQGTFKTTLAK